MVESENVKRMSDVLSQREHIAQIISDVTHVLMQLEIVNRTKDVRWNRVSNDTSSFTIGFKIKKPNYFDAPLEIIINPVHGTNKRELRVMVIEGEEFISFDEHDPGLENDDDKIFHIEEHLFIIDLHTKLSALKYKTLEEQLVKK